MVLRHRETARLYCRATTQPSPMGTQSPDSGEYAAQLRYYAGRDTVLYNMPKLATNQVTSRSSLDSGYHRRRIAILPCIMPAINAFNKIYKCSIIAQDSDYLRPKIAEEQFH